MRRSRLFTAPLVGIFSVLLLGLPHLVGATPPLCAKLLGIVRDTQSFPNDEVLLSASRYLKRVSEYMNLVDRAAGENYSLVAAVYSSEATQGLPALRQDYQAAMTIVNEINNYRELRAETGLSRSDRADIDQIVVGLKSDLREKLERLETRLLNPMGQRQETVMLSISIAQSSLNNNFHEYVEKMAKMYQEFFENQSWKLEIVDVSKGAHGTTSVQMEITGRGVLQILEREAGLHRVEYKDPRRGQMHTGHVGVTVLSISEHLKEDFPDSEFDIEFTHSRGPGGQNVNKVETAVRITHIPTGEVVRIEETSSQRSNLERAKRILIARLMERRERERHAAGVAQSREQLGFGDSATTRIRTYDFDRRQVTDHRSGHIQNLDSVFEGELTEMIYSVRLKALERDLEVAEERLIREIENLRRSLGESNE